MESREKIITLPYKVTATEIITQIGFILLLSLGGLLFFGAIGLFAGSIISGADIAGMTNNPSKEAILSFKIVQIFSAIGVFLFPAILFPILIQKTSLKNYYQFNNHSNLLIYFGLALMYFAWMPFLEFTIQLNKALVLPDSLSSLEQWMKDKELAGEVLTKHFLAMNSFSDFLLNLFVIALLPAITEELFFRGLIQRVFWRWTKKVHLSVWVTGFIFSFIHFQFYGFLPRALMGVLFGYLLVLTSDIKAPILLHFINNGTAVIASYLAQIKNKENIIPDDTHIPPLLTVLSTILATVLLFGIVKMLKKKKKEENIKPSVIGNHTYQRIFSTQNQSYAQIIHNKLLSEGISSVLLNKQDSSYTSFGWVEIYTQAEDTERANDIINQRLSIN